MPNQDAAGLLSDESFINFCLKRNPEDIAHWENYLMVNPDERDHFEELRSIILMTTQSVQHTEMQAHLENLRERIAYAEKDVYATPLKRNFPIIWKAAVAITGVLLAAWAYVFYFSNTKSSLVTGAPVTYATLKAEKRKLVLPDGSTVILNADSRISFADDFNQQTRTVQLEGEAFFDVVHNTAKPFIVKTSRMDVKVLGTAFNVKDYKDDKESETSLIRGSVELSLKSEHKIIRLHPNQKYLLKESVPVAAAQIASTTDQHNSGLLPVRVNREDSAIVEVSWTEDKLVFVDESLEDLAKKLERWYGVKIDITNTALKNNLYTASFRRETIEDVLAALQFSKPFAFERQNNTIMIY